MGSKIAVIGTGYVGLTTGACLAHLGHDVVCADIVPEKVEALNRGEIPILEAGLRRPGARGPALGRAAVRARRRERGRRGRVRVPLRARRPRARTARPTCPTSRPRPSRSRPHLQTESVVINKSTVPVGSTWVVEQALGRADVFVVSNPEFLREGSAVHDFLHPDRVVIGSDDQGAAIRVAALYLGLAAPLHGHRSGVGGDHQVRQQRLPRHEDPLRERHRRGVRGRRRRRQRRRARAWATTSASANEFLRPGPGWGGQLLPEGLAGDRPHRRGRRLRLPPPAGRDRGQRRSSSSGSSTRSSAWPAARSSGMRSPRGA